MKLTQEEFDKQLYGAEIMLMRLLRRFRIGGQVKEKYNTIRAYVRFWDGGLHSLIWPGYHYTQNEFIAYKLDRYVIQPFTKWTGLHWLGVMLQMKLYGLSYYLVVRRYPAIEREITCCADWPELLFGKKKIKKETK